MQFYHLTDLRNTRHLAEWAKGEVQLDTVICPEQSGHQRAGKRLSNLSIVLPSLTVEDVTWTWYNECIVQDPVLSFFKDQGFSGFEVKPVKARFKHPADIAPPILWELVVTGWAGMASARSGVKEIRFCPACRLKQYSTFRDPTQLIDPSQWDGSDFFMVWPLPRFVFIRERVSRAIGARKLSGVRVLPIADLKYDHELGGGRLSYWMPESRAKQLGSDLGID